MGALMMNLVNSRGAHLNGFEHCLDYYATTAVSTNKQNRIING